MEIRHIRYFLTLSEELHFRRAAEKLFIAQPALSRQIKELETELGVVLFNRDKRNVSLTLAGKFLKEEGYKLVKHVNSIQSSISEIGKTLSGTINIGCIGSAMSIIIPDLIQKISEDLPGIRTNLIEGTTHDLTNALVDRQIDIMFSRPIMKLANISSQVIYHESSVLVVAQNNKWAIDAHSKIADLANVPFILFPREAGLSFREQIIKICSQEGFYPKIMHESIHSNSLLRLVEKDLGVSIIPESLASGYALKVTFLRLKDFDISVNLAISCRKDNEDDLVKEIFEMAIQSK